MPLKAILTSLAVGIAAVLVCCWSGAWAQPAIERATLQTPYQVAADRLVVQLLADPGIKAAMASLEIALAHDPASATADGRARLDHDLQLWTANLIRCEISADAPTPQFLWINNNAPHRWQGMTVPGDGLPGDNPDAVYRSATIDGGGRYEIVGRLAAKPPAQWSFEIVRGSMVQIGLKQQNKGHADIGNQVAMVTSPHIDTGPDGAFRIAIDSDADRPNHLRTEPGLLTIISRDMLADWDQRPEVLVIRRLDEQKMGAGQIDAGKVRGDTLAALRQFVHFWAAFKDTWLGGLKPNTVQKPVARDGGWGYVAGGRFDLSPDQAMVIKARAGGAAYTGIELTDPWMMALDAVDHQGSLNLAQAVPNADGSYTYVIAASDPGVANWLDTGGLHHGYVQIRWQAVPATATSDSLLQGSQIVTLAEARRLPDIARVTPDQRRQLLSARATGYHGREHSWSAAGPAGLKH